jgi:ribosomal protein L37AE/L43A
MPIAFKCPHCGRDYSLPRKSASTIHRCHVCGTQAPVVGEVTETVEFEAVGSAAPPLTVGSGPVKVIEGYDPGSEGLSRPIPPPAAPSESGRVEPGRPCPSCGRRMRLDAVACDSCGRTFSMRLSAPSFVNEGLVRQFAVEINALGALWLLQAAVIAGLAFGAVDAAGSAARTVGGIPVAYVVAGVFAALGGLTFLRIIWPTYLGVAVWVAYLITAFGLIQLILVAVILAQSVRVILWAKEMRAAGLSRWGRPAAPPAAVAGKPPTMSGR